jgi:hypothetical protein
MRANVHQPGRLPGVNGCREDVEEEYVDGTVKGAL